jgi:hypothetical protein
MINENGLIHENVSKAKRPYTAPQISYFGTIGELTQSATGFAPDQDLSQGALG